MENYEEIKKPVKAMIRKLKRASQLKNEDQKFKIFIKPVRKCYDFEIKKLIANRCNIEVSMNVRRNNPKKNKNASGNGVPNKNSVRKQDSVRVQAPESTNATNNEEPANAPGPSWEPTWMERQLAVVKEEITLEESAVEGEEEESSVAKNTSESSAMTIIPNEVLEEMTATNYDQTGEQGTSSTDESENNVTNENTDNEQETARKVPKVKLVKIPTKKQSNVKSTKMPSQQLFVGPLGTPERWIPLAIQTEQRQTVQQMQAPNVPMVQSWTFNPMSVGQQPIFTQHQLQNNVLAPTMLQQVWTPPVFISPWTQPEHQQGQQQQTNSIWMASPMGEEKK